MEGTSKILGISGGLRISVIVMPFSPNHLLLLLTILINFPLLSQILGAAAVISVASPTPTLAIAAADQTSGVEDARNQTSESFYFHPSINDEEPYCWEREFVTQEPAFSDCLATARDYKEDPFYTDNITYTLDPARLVRTADRQVPVYWRHNTCVLYVGAIPGSMDLKFTLASKWPVVSRLFAKCLIEPKPGHKVGGFIWLHHQPQAKGYLAYIGSQPRSPSLGGGYDLDLVAAAVGGAVRWNVTE